MSSEMDDMKKQFERACAIATALSDANARLSKRVIELNSLLRDIAGCPYTLDPASVPSCGIEAAKNKNQIVGVLSVRYPLYKKLRSFMEEVKTI